MLKIPNGSKVEVIVPLINKLGIEAE